jgi:acetylornithine/N-succinyldiaminopimelate aminotransferase
MNLFPVYSLYDIELVKGKMSYVYDKNDKAYLDLYGGHAVISVGHSHPDYVKALKKQLATFVYYSNSVQLPIQRKLANKLGKASRCFDYQLFLCNSGAEAIENAIKIASFETGRSKILCFEGAFHGRTHGALAVTDDPKISAPINQAEHVIRIPFNDAVALKKAFKSHGKEIAAVIIETIQGVAGIVTADSSFLNLLERLCFQNEALLIADEVQSGFGRTGKFFAFQHFNIQPHLITMAKGMGNGFPIGGVLIHPNIKASLGMLGTTFGGNPLACAASIAVLDIIKNEDLKQNAIKQGEYLVKQLLQIEEVKSVSGLGLMLGVTFDFPIRTLRDQMALQHNVLTGNAKDPNVLRILPPLNIKKKEIDLFLQKLLICLENIK